MRDVAILGRDHIKVDSLDKVLGRAKFAADYYMPDMLYGGVFRSTVPHAYIKKLNLEKARALPGVAAVLDYTAIPGKNRFGIIVKDEPCLVDDKVRRYGDAIAVVAAETPEIVQEAMQLIEVEYEELPVINSYESAMAEGAICVHGTTTSMPRSTWSSAMWTKPGASAMLSSRTLTPPTSSPTCSSSRMPALPTMTRRAS